jgi:RNA recognition motif-containing protein
MGRRLYVGNIPFSAGEADLRDLFAQVGEIDSVYVVTDRDTGRPRGFAFVEMANDEDAQKAINNLDQTEFQGRRLAVNEARPRAPRPMDSGSGAGPMDSGFGGGRREPRW